MFSRRWRARLGLFAAFFMGSSAIGSLAARSAEHRRLLRAHFPGRPSGAAPAHAFKSSGKSSDPKAPAEMSTVAQSLPRATPPR